MFIRFEHVSDHHKQNFLIVEQRETFSLGMDNQRLSISTFTVFYSFIAVGLQVLPIGTAAKNGQIGLMCLTVAAIFGISHLMRQWITAVKESTTRICGISRYWTLLNLNISLFHFR